MTRIAIGITCDQVTVGDLADVVERGCLAGDAVIRGAAWSRRAAAAAWRMAGTAFIAAVEDGSPAFRPASNWIVRPSALTYCAVARYTS